MSPALADSATNLQRYRDPRPGAIRRGLFVVCHFTSSTPWTTPSSTPSAARSTPKREATLARDERSARLLPAVRVRFPIKNGLPVLVPDEADTARPAARRQPASLPCQRRAGASRDSARRLRVPLCYHAAGRSPCDSGLVRLRVQADARTAPGLVRARWPSSPPARRPPRRRSRSRTTCRATTSTSRIDTDEHKARLPRRRSPGRTATTRPAEHSSSTSTRTTASRAATTLLLAKTLELLRLQPSLGIDRDGRHGVVKTGSRSAARRPDGRWRTSYGEDNPTALRGRAAASRSSPGESVTVELDCDDPPAEQAGPVGSLGRRHVPDERAAGARVLRRRRLAADAVRPVAPAVLERGRRLHAPRSRCRRNRCSPARRRSQSETDLGDGWKQVVDRAVRRPRLRVSCAAPTTRSSPADDDAARRPRRSSCGASRSPEHEFYATEILEDRRRGDPGLLAVVRRRSRTTSSPSPSRTSAGTATSAPASS